MGTMKEFIEPVVVIDSPLNNSRVSVIQTSTGPYLLFDTPTGEVKFRFQEDEWKKLQDAVWLAMNNRGVFDGTGEDLKCK